MKTIAICIGHSRKINGRFDGGAVSVGNVQERTYNGELAKIIKRELEADGVTAIIIDEYEGGGYTSAMTWLAGQIKDIQADAAIELHFNSASETARGHEWLYWHSSANSKRLANEIEDIFSEVLPGMPNRGIKAIDGSDRGGEFLRRTHCPAVIAEPFFGSNSNDWEIATAHKETIGIAIASGIATWLGVLTGETSTTPPPPVVTTPPPATEEWIAKATSCTRKADGSFAVSFEIKQA